MNINSLPSTDILIQIGTILLILSLLTEKTSQFIRDYTPKANNIVIALTLLLQIYTTIYLCNSDDAIEMCAFNKSHTVSDSFIIWILIFFIAVNIAILLLSFLGKYHIKKKLDGKGFNLLRTGIFAFIIIFSYVTNLFFGLILLGELVFFLACISLSIIQLKIFKYGKKGKSSPSFLTIPNVEHGIPISKYYKATTNNPDINFLAFVIGVFYAAIFGLNILDFGSMNGKSGLVLNPTKFNLNAFLTYNIGDVIIIGALVSYIFSGFFLSFGSKFFHDLLDLLFLFKKTKQAALDPDLYTWQNADEVITFVEDYQIRYHLEEKRDELHKIPEVYGTGIIEKVESGKVVEMIQICSTREDLDLEPLFTILSKDRSTKKIPYSIKLVDGPALVLGDDILEKNKTIFNDKEPNKSGSFCCLVDLEGKSGKYLLTCYHVVKQRKHAFARFDPNRDYKGIGQESNTIGTIYQGCITSYIDAALVEVTKDLNLKNFQNDPLPVAKIKFDFTKGDRVAVYGQQTGRMYYGRVTVTDERYSIHYKNENQNHDLYLLFGIGDTYNNESLSQEGDSGGCVFKDNQPIGMIVALESSKEKRNTLVISLSEIFREYPEIKNIYPMKLF